MTSEKYGPKGGATAVRARGALSQNGRIT